MSATTLEYIHKLDVFNIVRRGGLSKGFVFYVLGSIGIISLTMAMIVMIQENRDNPRVQWQGVDIKNDQFKAQLHQEGQHKHIKQLNYIEQTTDAGLQKYHQTEFKLTNNHLINNEHYCLSLSNSESPLQGINTCSNEQVGFTIRPTHTQLLTYNQLQELGYCQQDDCHHFCSTVGIIQYESGCQITLPLKEICFIYNKSGQIVDGCFNHEYELYAPNSNKQVKLTMRHESDPFNKQTHQSVMGFNTKILFVMGGLSFVGCLLMLVLLVINPKQQEDEIEMRVISVRRNQTVIPLNY